MSVSIQSNFSVDVVQFEPTYGLLYNWYAVNDLRGLAPTGWHVPSVEDYQTLISFLGGASIAGGPLKATAKMD